MTASPPSLLDSIRQSLGSVLNLRCSTSEMPSDNRTMPVRLLLRSRSFRTGALLVAAAGVLFLCLEWAASWEQAGSPEKDLGVAALGMLFGIPMLILGVGGAGLRRERVFLDLSLTVSQESGPAKRDINPHLGHYNAVEPRQ